MLGAAWETALLKAAWAQDGRSQDAWTTSGPSGVLSNPMATPRLAIMQPGVLTALPDAAKKKEFGRAVLLAMKAIGPNGAESAHMIALGDAIRALKRAGLEADARRLGLEALLGSWPRTAVN